MSFCKSGRDVTQDSSQFIQDYPRKGYHKIDPLEKLQMINALDNGQCKADVSKKFGVHIQTISYIYKQKESILGKYTQKYNILEKQARCANLDHILVEWLKHETKNGNVITEDQLRDKACECIKTTRDECAPISTDDWLLDFRIRHSIAKYASDIECSSQDKDHWLLFLQDLDLKDVYFGMTCALHYNFDFNKYVNAMTANSYVSVLMVTNAMGVDKRELAIVGKDLLADNIHLGSLPVNYYFSDCPQINYTLMLNYLKKWDVELKLRNSNVSLLLDMPDFFLEQFHLECIKLINTSKLIYASKIIEKIVQSFKYNYRKLQISRTVMYNKDVEQNDLVNYIYMISSAWYNVSSSYIERLTLPLSDGSLYFKNNDESHHDHTLSKWCKMHNITLKTGVSPQTLDKFMSCDNKLQSTNFVQSQDTQYTRELLFETSSQPTSGISAYQAIKRLVSYLQGEGADNSVIQHAHLLEDHLEYGALVEIHQIIHSTK